ncbi:hypothetical protein AAIP42_001003 [Flavobacterium psychrophilum]|nr:hypothetical protein [Flavobacterium psychrophilum]
MEYNIKEAVKEKCRITFEKIIDKSPYFPYQTFKVELIKEATSFLEKIKPRVDLSVNTSEKDIRTGIDSSIDIANLTQSQINAVYLHLIETVDYLNEIKPQTKAVPENPHPTIFTGIDNKNFTLFETFTKHHIFLKAYVDFSFIFQQMKFNGYILDIKHLKFMKWLRENNYITQKQYSEDFLIEKGFRTLKKCAFGTRVNLYLELQDSIILSSSDLSE